MFRRLERGKKLDFGPSLAVPSLSLGVHNSFQSVVLNEEYVTAFSYPTQRLSN